MIDDRTSNFNFPKPHASNPLIEDVERLRTALDGIDVAIGTREVASQKGQPNGYAGLDGSGKVPAAQLPSYVDDVIEVANLAALPGTGETGKLYVTIDTGRTYRWSGSAYVEISPSPGSTDSVPEGATNKYFTDARARAAQLPATASALGVIKVGSGLSVGLDGTLSVVGGGSGEGLPAFNELVLVPTSNGQTTFTPVGGYSAGEIDLYLNGVLLYGNGDDYTASNGTTIVLTAGVTTSDSLLLRRWTTTDNLPFSALTDKPTTLSGYGISDAVPKSGGAFDGGVSAPTMSDEKGNLREIPQVRSVSAGGALVASDAGGLVALAGDCTIAAATFSDGDVVMILNPGAADVTITITGTAYVSGIDTARTSVTLRKRGMVTVIRTGGSLWLSGAVQ